MTTFRTGSPPQPPEDWLAQSFELQQIRSLLEGKAICVDEGTPLTRKLYNFFMDPEVARLWHEQDQESPLVSMSSESFDFLSQENIKVGIYHVDAGTNIVACCEGLNYEETQLLGDRLKELFPGCQIIAANYEIQLKSLSPSEDK